MGWIKKTINRIIVNEDFQDLKSSKIIDFINGNILTKNVLKKQYPFLLFVALLTFLYVDNRFYNEKQLSKMLKMQRELRDIKYESLTISAELMKISRQSSIREMIKERGLTLREGNKPAVILNVTNQVEE